MDGGADGKHGGAARCVVWRAKGSPLPRDLSIALKRPDFQVTECDNQFEAVARLCTSREDRSQTVLLIVEPKVLPAIPEVGDVIDRYAPMTTMWVFESQPQPQIRAVTPADRAQWDKVSKATAPTPPATAVAAVSAAPQRVGPVLKAAVRDIAQDAVTTTRLKMPQAPKPPQLRLAGDDPPQTAPATPAQPEVKVRPAAQAAPEIKVRPIQDAQPKPLKPLEPQARDQAATPVSTPAFGPREGPEIQAVPSGKAGNLLSDEELEMLLAPDDGKGHY